MPDIVTPTESEARRADLGRRRRRYLGLMAGCLLLVLFGFFVPAPLPVRLVALAIGALIPPVAAIVGNAGSGGRGAR